MPSCPLSAGIKGCRKYGWKIKMHDFRYLSKSNKMLLLYRQGSSVVNNLWIGSAGGHFEKDELNDAGACVLRELEEETGLTAKCGTAGYPL